MIRAPLVVIIASCTAHVSAQSAITLSEMQTIAQGLDTCLIDTTYYVSPEALNDTGNSTSTPTYNYLNDQGGTFVIVPDWGYFKPTRQNLITAFNNWEGPYLNYQPARTQTATTPYDQGSPLDLWGGPYYLFSPLGRLRGDTGTVTLEHYADTFDQYTLVSLGSDGVKSSDDVTYQFGGGITITALSSARSATSASTTTLTAPANSPIVMRGVNLGATQSGAKVMWGVQELTNITSWSSREIALTLPPATQGSAALVMQRGTATTNALSLTIFIPPTAANDWQLYR
ncbi:MAG: IPT/TIG domain-containing protein [Candidatus Sumerlaeaceae bacterium]